MHSPTMSQKFSNGPIGRMARSAIGVLAGLVIAGALSTTPASAAVSFDVFYSNLSPHGHWMVSGSYGRVWQPAVYRPGWNPYYDGHWAYTNVGYTWVSDYSWGGIPYHYGTWVADPSLGWVWVPGYIWAPAWVYFREGPDYIGWAPVRPGFSIGVSVVSDYYDPYFVFVPTRTFIGVPVRQCAVPASYTKVVVNKTKIVNKNLFVENNVVVNRGPDVRVIERASGRHYQPTIDRSAVTVGGRSYEPVRNVTPAAARPSERSVARPAAIDRTVSRTASVREPRAQTWAAREPRVQAPAVREPRGQSFDRAHAPAASAHETRGEPVDRARMPKGQAKKQAPQNASAERPEQRGRDKHEG